MERKKLFPQVDALLHGGDYNPEQWLDRPDILEEDIRLMKEAGVNTATLGVFSWSVYEPVEGEYHFEWLDEIIDNLYKNGIYTILATPSGARPAWLDEKYPEALRTASNGTRNRHGERHNHCITSPKYRELVRKMDTMLAKRYGNHPGLIMWHISNELGGECWCDLCKAKFQKFLSKKFDGDIDKLNHEYWTTFWSHRYNNFEQIDPPMKIADKSIHGLNLDWHRFTTWNTIDFIKDEMEILRKYSPNVPITTNFMHLYPALDYHKVSKALDVISWDSYPRWNSPDSTLYDTAMGDTFDNAIMRSFKPDRPFMMMESVPNLVNWHEYNKAKRPKVHKLTSMHTLSMGSDTIQYFQWRKGRGSFEQYHGAVMDHLGRSDTRTFLDVKEVGEALQRLQKVQGSIMKPKVALFYDWDNKWAIEDCAALSKKTKKYPETVMEMFNILTKLGVEVDVISQEENVSAYNLVLAPMLYLLKPGTAARLKDFVKNGGTLLTTYFTGYVNENTLCHLGGFPGDGLTELFGLYSEEIDTLYPKDVNGVEFGANSPIGGSFPVKDYCDILKVQTAEVLATYTDDFYKGTPAITRNAYGEGMAYYVGARVEKAGMEVILRALLAEAKVEIKELPANVEYHKREADGESYEFYMNYNEEAVTVTVEEGVDLLTSNKVAGDVVIPGLETIVVAR